MQSNLGAPIAYDRRYGGYRYHQSGDAAPFELPGFWFTKNEIEAILSLDRAVESMQGDFLKEMFEPVRKRFEPLLKAHQTSMSTLRERIKIISIGHRECDKGIFRSIAAAVVRRRRVAIEHHTLENHGTLKRDISPQALVRYRDNWYVDAFCHLRNGLRTFALNRIESAEFATGKFRMVSKEGMQAFFGDAYGIFTGPADKKAEIVFTGTAAREVSKEQWHPKQTGTWVDETTYRLILPYGHSRELVMDILRWGRYAEVKGPKELRKEIMETIEGMVKKYKRPLKIPRI